MKPGNLRKARAKVKELMAKVTHGNADRPKKKTTKLGLLTKKATGVISLKGADYKDILSEELAKKYRRNV
jgi:hypothetical protein